MPRVTTVTVCPYLSSHRRWAEAEKAAGPKASLQTLGEGNRPGLGRAQSEPAAPAERLAAVVEHRTHAAHGRGWIEDAEVDAVAERGIGLHHSERVGRLSIDGASL